MPEQKDIGMPMKEDWEILQFDPNKIVQRQRELGKDWVEKQAYYEELIDLKKPTRDDNASTYLNGGKGIGESEMRGNASNKYREFLAKLSDARKEAMLAKVDYDSFCNWVQLLRSKGANLRTEMQLANIT